MQENEYQTCKENWIRSGVVAAERAAAVGHWQN